MTAAGPEPAVAILRRGIALLNAISDGADDEEVTPSEIAEVIRDAREAVEAEEHAARPRIRRFLREALDAVDDGMSAEYIAMILYAALGAAQEPAGG